MKFKYTGKIIRLLRELRLWSQEQLAEIAKVSARTVQRVEADQECSTETLGRLAKAFGLEPHELLMTLANAENASENPIDENQLDLPVMLEQITEGKTLLEIVGDTHGSFINHPPLDADEDAELISGFFEIMRDYGDIYSEMEIPNRIRAGMEIGKAIKRLEEHGFLVYAKRVCRETVVNNQSMMWVTAALVVIPEGDPRIHPVANTIALVLPKEINV